MARAVWSSATGGKVKYFCTAASIGGTHGHGKPFLRRQSRRHRRFGHAFEKRTDDSMTVMVIWWWSFSPTASNPSRTDMPTPLEKYRYNYMQYNTNTSHKYTP